MTNKYNTVFYTGITSNLEQRIIDHKDKKIKGFTKQYNIDKLIYYEFFNTPNEAILREKQIKGWLRQKKVVLIKKENPQFKDLASHL